MRLLVATLVLTLSTLGAQAQNYLKAKSADYLRRTAYMIVQTHKEMVKLDSAQKDGKFSMAVAHQRMARKSFEVGDYKNAVYYSAYARRQIQLVYSTFNPMFTAKFRDTPEEMEMVKNTPNDKTLHDNVLKANPSIKFNDNDYLGDAKLYKLDVDDLVQP